eukprot:1777018-Pyramimonas_sp.AAC.1
MAVALSLIHVCAAEDADRHPPPFPPLPPPLPPSVPPPPLPPPPPRLPRYPTTSLANLFAPPLHRVSLLCANVAQHGFHREIRHRGDHTYDALSGLEGPFAFPEYCMHEACHRQWFEALRWAHVEGPDGKYL